MLLEALNYVRLGYSVVPLKPMSKEPLIPWKEFQQRRASEDEIKEWFTLIPNANIGIVTGRISCLAVIDLDGPEGIESAQRLKLQSSLVSLTGSGKHLWYQNLDGLSNSVRQYPGIDVRAEGGFIVAPPSIHESGKRYRLLGHAGSALSLPPFPKEIFVSNAAKDIVERRNSPDWIVKALQEMTDGNIDNTLFRICSWFRNAGASEATCTAFIRPYAERVNATPGHLEDKIRNVWSRYEPKVSSMSMYSTGQQPRLLLHSPSNPDSLNEYNIRQSVGLEMGGRTGYSKLDALTKGLRPGEIFTLAARTGVGKTNWILPVIKTFCEENKKVVLFSTEMSFDQIWNRYRNLLQDGRFEDHQFFVCDEFTPNSERIEEALKEVMPDLFIFDHINHVGTDYHQLSKFMMSLKELSRKFNIPGIVTAQLSRLADWVEKGEKVTPRLSMIKGSGSIEEVSAQVLLLHEKRVHDTYTEIEGILDKNRYGEKGQIMFGLMKTPYQMKEL